MNIQQNTINSFDTFLKNTGQTIASQISNQNTSVTLDDMFPIRTEEELEIFEEKIKGDKIFRNTAVILHIFFNIYFMSHMYDMGFFKETPCHTYVTLGGERVNES